MSKINKPLAGWSKDLSKINLTVVAFDPTTQLAIPSDTVTLIHRAVNGTAKEKEQIAADHKKLFDVLMNYIPGVEKDYNQVKNNFMINPFGVPFHIYAKPVDGDSSQTIH